MNFRTDEKVRCQLVFIYLNIALLYFMLLTLVDRLLANNTTDVEDKKHFLLDGLSQIQLGVLQQEQVVLNVRTLFPSMSEVGRLDDGWMIGILSDPFCFIVGSLFQCVCWCFLTASVRWVVAGMCQAAAASAYSSG